MGTNKKISLNSKASSSYLYIKGSSAQTIGVTAGSTGSIEFVGDGYQHFVTPVGSPTLILDKDVTVKMTGFGGVGGGGSFWDSTRPWILNGAFNVNVNAPSAIVTTNVANITRAGGSTVNVQAGTLRLNGADGDADYNGAWDIASTAILNLNHSGTRTLGAGFLATGSGRISNQSGTLNINGMGNNTLRFGGTATTNFNSAITIGGLDAAGVFGINANVVSSGLIDYTSGSALSIGAGSTLTANGGMNWGTGSTVSGGGTLLIPTGQTLALTGGSKFLTNATITNQGTTSLNLTAGNVLYLSTNAAITNSGTWTFAAAGANGVVTNSGASTITNTGVVQNTGAGTASFGGTSTTFASTGGSYANSGSGVMNLGSGVSNAYSGTTTFTGSGVTLSTGTHAFAVGSVLNGPFTLGAATATFNNTTANGLIDFTGSGTLTVNAGNTLTVNGGLNWSGGGAINGAGALTINSVFNWNGGTISGTGVLNTNGTVNVTAPVVGILSGKTWNNTGTINIPLGSGGLELNSATINNLAGGSINIASADATPIYTFGGGVVNNAGIFTYNNAASVGINTALNNTGTVDVQSGTLSFTQGGYSGGVINIASGHTLNWSKGVNPWQFDNGTVVQGGGTLNLTSGAGTFTGAGSGITVQDVGTTLNIAGANISASGNITVGAGGTLGMMGGSATFNPGSVVNIQSGATLGVSAISVNLGMNATIAGAINVGIGGIATIAPTSGTLTPSSITVVGSSSYDTAHLNFTAPNGAITVPNVTTNNGGAIAFGSDVTIGNLSILGFTGGLVGPGNVVLAAGGTHLWNTGGFAGGINVTIAPGANLTINTPALKQITNATFVNQGTISWNDGDIDLEGAAILNNSGAFNIALAGSRTLGNVFAGPGTLALTNTGTITKTVANSATFDGSVTLTNASTGSLNVNGGTLQVNNFALNTNSGVISGSGTLNLGGATLTNSGTIKPGGTGAAGTLSITGNLVNSGSGTIEAELGGTTAGTQYDVLAVSGNVTLGGTLNSTLINSYVPTAGPNFDIITAGGTASGSFATLNVYSGINGAIVGSVYRLNYSGVLCSGICWDGGAGTLNWMDALNWTTDVVPTSPFDVEIKDLGGATILFSALSNETVKSLTFLGNDALSISAGSLTFSNASSMTNAALNLSGGTLNANGNLALKNLNFTGGAFNIGSGATMTLSGASTWATGSAISGPGTLAISGTGTLALTTIADRVLNGATLNNAGLITSAMGTRNLYVNGGAVINNSGTYQFQSGSNDAINRNSGAGTFNNTGTLESLSANANLISVAFNNTGGTLEASGANNLTINAPTSHSGALTISGNNVFLSGGAQAFADGSSVSGRLNLSGAAATFGSTTVNGLINYTAGSLGIGSGDTLTAAGGLNWATGNAISGPGTLSIPTGQTLALTTISDRVLDNARLDNAGTISSAMGTRNLFVNNGAVINNSGLYQFQSGSNDAINRNSGVGTFNNTGTLESPERQRQPHQRRLQQYRRHSGGERGEQSDDQCAQQLQRRLDPERQQRLPLRWCAELCRRQRNQRASEPVRRRRHVWQHHGQRHDQLHRRHARHHRWRYPDGNRRTQLGHRQRHQRAGNAVDPDGPDAGADYHKRPCAGQRETRQRRHHQLGDGDAQPVRQQRRGD
ncbi:MAG: hypothetical protein IPJ48_10325 [Propionivibrio sp.]|uniref:Uncharacterized protein n=1 Tax=Candidatus Propionivibrio dominans TaxID=2954373 RepID=A0A9D7I8T9_9RHOO|nr:hypothetical protein [Candidatus Propionivibrio dominans]